MYLWDGAITLPCVGIEVFNEDCVGIFGDVAVGL